ncbi:MAG: OmpA family protein [Flavobacteriales bacterium]|nr:OmpA family protein [Flavobacteriales bacterium]MBP6698257.1 OmpA family protein [Flavobacteriales bacterium]
MRAAAPIFLVLSCFSGMAQDLVLHAGAEAGSVHVRGVSSDTTAPQPLFQATWRYAPDVAEPAFTFLRTANSPVGSLMLDRLVEAGIGAYLDHHVQFTRDGVRTDQPLAYLVLALEGQVRSAAEEFQAADLFTGFSPPTREQLDRLLQLDWSQARMPIDASGDGDRYLAIYRFVRSQREELERQFRADLLPLATIAVLGATATDPGTTVEVPSVCGTVFDQENFLCALDLSLADTGRGEVDPPLLEMPTPAVVAPPPAAEVVQAPARIRKRDRWLKAELDGIHERIDRMDQRKQLWELRDRMDDIQGQVDDLRLQVDDVRADQGSSNGSENPIANLSALTGRDITVRFLRASADLEPEQRLLLNEVFEQLARAPRERVLITGYTDRSGDAAVNLALSEWRARTVRNYLLQRGIAPERLLVNYYGDSRSNGRDPSERRVEIEWLSE